jgi:UTP:GlnB (protein PII) uridylyltransferase
VTRTAVGTQRVELWDNTLPVAWLSNFTGAATRKNIDIIRGNARRDAERCWSARFEIRGANEGDLERVDFLALAREASVPELVSNLELEAFELSRSAERANVLSLRIQARDRVGFLASLLAHLAGFVLFPEEIRIDTHHQLANDALWLSAVGGMSPAPEIERALRASLRECTRDRLLPPRP